MEIAHRVITTAGAWVPDRTMSQSVTPTSKSVGTIEASTPTTPRTFVADLTTDYLRLTDWHVFRTVAEVSEDSIHEVRA